MYDTRKGEGDFAGKKGPAESPGLPRGGIEQGKALKCFLGRSDPRAFQPAPLLAEEGHAGSCEYPPFLSSSSRGHLQAKLAYIL